MSVAELRRPLADALPASLTLLEELVNLDSPFDDPEGVRTVLDRLARRFEPLDASLEWRAENGFPHLRATLPGGERRVALLGHADTVFVRGTAALRPFRVDSNTAFGPGVADMKGGLVVAVAALERLVGAGEPRPTVEVVIVGDEEVRLTPPPFMDVLMACDACLVLEAAGAGGRFVVARRAGAWARLVARGRAAHSGTAPERGSSAILAVCRELVRIAEIDGARPGVTVSVGKIGGGSLTNVVPELAEASLDIRSYEPEVLEATLADVRKVGAHGGVEIALEIDGRWPRMSSTPATEALAAVYERLAREAGIPATAERRGGMSDGCWTADAGVPTLDGLGPIGQYDHSPEEYIEVSSLSDRAAVLVALLVEMEKNGIPPGGGQDDA